MKVYLTFDTEVWCQGWESLDEQFPVAFQRYVYGRTAKGDYALPKTLEILNRFGLCGVFFVESLFAARFGSRYLREIVQLIDRAGHDIQLHVHAEWSDEIRPTLLPAGLPKRQYLSQFSREEQATLIGWSKSALEQELGRAVTAFRAGNFATNTDTFAALGDVGIFIDSSPNDCVPFGNAGLLHPGSFSTALCFGDVVSYPVSNFRDGLGRKRPAHVSACSFEELRDALFSAARGGCEHFVIVSHNFEMLKRGRNEPDDIVADRFTRLCELLSDYPALFQVGAYSNASPTNGERPARAKLLSTGQRHLEQFRRMAS